MTKLRISGFFGGAIALSASLFALAGGCSSASNNDAPMREATWAITSQCNTCLRDTCALTPGAPDPYQSCSVDLVCSDAFGGFVNCYRRTRSLSQCSTEVESLIESGDAGRELLQNCFLLDCFAGTCEETGQ